MDSALTHAAGIQPHERQQIILPTEEEKKRLQALANAKALHERTKPLMVAPSTVADYIFLGEQLKLVRVAKKTLLGLWRPYVDELLEKKNTAYSQMMEGAKLMDELESSGDKLILDYDRIQREAAQRQQAQVQQIVNTQFHQEAQAASDDQRIELAIEAEASGNSALAEEILNAPTPAPVVMPPAVVLQTHTPQIEGFSKRVTWKGRLKGSDKDNPVPPAAFELLITAVAEDIKKSPDQRRGLISLLKLNDTSAFELLITAVAEDIKKSPDQRRGLISLLKPNDTSLSAMAKAMKAQFNVPGCESYEETGLAKRV